MNTSPSLHPLLPFGRRPDLPSRVTMPLVPAQRLGQNRGIAVLNLCR